MCTRYTDNKNTHKFNNISNLRGFKAVFAFILFVFAFLLILENNSRKIIARAESENTSIEASLSDETDKILEDVDFSEVEDLLLEMEFDFELFGGNGFKDFVSDVISGKETIEVSDIFNIISSGLIGSIKELLLPLTIILTIVLLCTMFNNIKSNKVSGVGEVVYFFCFAIIVIIIVKLSAGVLTNSKRNLLNLQKQMNSIFPILLSLMTMMGGVVSVKAYTPMFAFLSNTISNIFIYMLLPLFVLSLVLSIVGNLSSNTKLGKLNSFLHSLFKWIIGVVFAVYMAFISLKGMTAGASDGISIKATKYAIKNYIPMLGGYISDGFELVKAGGMLVKNATGFTSMLLLFGTIITPVLSIALLELGLKLLAGIIEPIGDSRSSGLLFSIAKSLKLLVVVLVGVALMYFLTIFLVTCSVSNFV